MPKFDHKKEKKKKRKKTQGNSKLSLFNIIIIFYYYYGYYEFGGPSLVKSSEGRRLEFDSCPTHDTNSKVS
jgi:hypothetical protein